MTDNLYSRMATRRPGNPMRDYDRLPPELRNWLAHATLPWSPQSARRIWTKAGGGASALSRLDAVEAATLEKERKADSTLRKAIRS